MSPKSSSSPDASLWRLPLFKTTPTFSRPNILAFHQCVCFCSPDTSLPSSGFHTRVGKDLCDPVLENLQANLLLTHYPPNTFPSHSLLGQVPLFSTTDVGRSSPAPQVLMLLVFLMLASQPTFHHIGEPSWESPLCYPLAQFLVILSIVLVKLVHILYVTY